MAYRHPKPRAASKGFKYVLCDATDCDNGSIVDEDGTVTFEQCENCKGSGWLEVPTTKTRLKRLIGGKDGK